MIRFAAVFAAFLGSWTTVSAENWPQWRGARHNGISDERDVPVRWSRDENVRWRLPLPGPAGSTPVTWDDRIFLTSVDASGALLLLCVGTDGREGWRQTLDSGNRDVRGDEGNSASNSPATDGRHVWAMVATGAIGCFTVAGEPVWKFNVSERYGALNIQFGMTSTPLLDNGRLYLQLIHGDGEDTSVEARVVCLNAATGEEIWSQRRVTGATNENEHAYASPILFRDAERAFLVTHGGDFTIAHRLEDGREIWRYGLNPHTDAYHPTLRLVATPAAGEGMIVIPSAKNGPVAAVTATATGEVAARGDAVRWRLDRGTPDVPSPVIRGGLVYLCRENGVLVCVDGATGEIAYEERLYSDRYRASPLYAHGHLYLASRKGVVSVVREGRAFHRVAEIDMGEPISASPIVSGGILYLRSFDALYAIGGK
ncbi:MAG: pyrrolo-quinoline quinone [Planctomycetes bacterium]|nr:pyrrolo-quinoline quinone [Planctomycetota bacterium]